MSRYLLLLEAVFIAFFSTAVYGQKFQASVDPINKSHLFSEPIILNCTITNDSNDTIAIDLGERAVAKISVVVNPDAVNPAVLPYTIHRGGLTYPGEAKIAAHSKLTRYVVLDQWFRPPYAGSFKLALRFLVDGQFVTVPFTIDVARYDKPLFYRSIRRMVMGKLELTSNESKADEWFSYKMAVLTALSYLADTPGDILAELQKNGDLPFSDEFVNLAKAMGPGGCSQLD